MPTGYTAAIKDGISFEKFVLDCSRAFGALITMRDDPMDAQIPDEFKPDGFYKENLIKAKAALADFECKTEEQLINLWRIEHEESVKNVSEWNADNALLKGKYKHMLDKVTKWEPPTDEHIGLKDLMIKQINDSIQFDCHLHEIPPQETFEMWKSNKLHSLKRSVNSSEESYQKEIDRCKGRAEWVQALFNSLGIKH